MDKFVARGAWRAAVEQRVVGELAVKQGQVVKGVPAPPRQISEGEGKAVLLQAAKRRARGGRPSALDEAAQMAGDARAAARDPRRR